MMKSKTWRIVGLVLLAFVLIGFAVNLFINYKVNERIGNISGLKVESVDCSFFNNALQLNGIEFHRDSVKGVKGACTSLRFSGFKRIKYLSKNEIGFKEVIAEGADIYIDLDKNPQLEDSTGTTKSQNLTIGDFVIRQGTLHLMKSSNEIITIEDVHVRIQDIHFNKSDSFTMADYFIRTGLLKATLPNNEHQLEVKASSYDPDDGILKLKAFRYYTNIPKEKWFKSVEKKKTRMDWVVDEIQITKFDIPGFVNHKSIEAQKIEISNSKLELFEDMRFDHCQTCVKKLPHVNLLASKSKINVDSLQLKNIHLAYLANIGHGVAWGKIDFEQLYASVHNITNKKSRIRKNPSLLVDAQTMLFGNTPLVTRFNVDLSSNSGAYSYKGTCGGFDLTLLNEFLRPVKHVMVSHGVAGNMAFSVTADQHKSEGQMNFPYKNLKVAFLTKQKNKKSLISGLVNGLAVKTHNIPGDEQRAGIIYHERDPSRSIFNEISQSLQTGIQSSALAKYLLPEELRQVDK